MKKQFTYLMYDGRHYKIGKSKDPIHRFRQLQTSNPFLELVSYYEGDIEILCHQTFWRNRVKNEWFKFDDKTFKLVIDFMSSKSNSTCYYSLYQNL